VLFALVLVRACVRACACMRACARVRACERVRSLVFLVPSVAANCTQNPCLTFLSQSVDTQKLLSPVPRKTFFLTGRGDPMNTKMHVSVLVGIASELYRGAFCLSRAPGINGGLRSKSTLSLTPAWAAPGL